MKLAFAVRIREERKTLGTVSNPAIGWKAHNEFSASILLYTIMITLTEQAAKHFSSILRTSGNNTIRVSLRKAGCSGSTYQLSMEDNYLEWHANDHVFESQGIFIVCDKKDLPYFDGMEIAFTSNGLDSKVAFMYVCI